MNEVIEKKACSFKHEPSCELIKTLF